MNVLVDKERNRSKKPSNSGEVETKRRQRKLLAAATEISHDLCRQKAIDCAVAPYEHMYKCKIFIRKFSPNVQVYLVDLQEEVILCVFWCRLPMHDLACAFSFSTECFLLIIITQRTLWTSYFPFVLLQVLCMSCHSNWKVTLDDFLNIVHSCRLRLPTKCTWYWYSHSSKACNKGRFCSCLTEKQKCSYRLYWWFSKSKSSIPSSDDLMHLHH